MLLRTLFYNSLYFVLSCGTYTTRELTMYLYVFFFLVFLYFCSNPQVRFINFISTYRKKGMLSKDEGMSNLQKVSTINVFFF